MYMDFLGGGDTRLTLLCVDGLMDANGIYDACAIGKIGS